MEIRLFQGTVVLNANTLTVTLLAMNEVQAKELFLKALDKETRVDIESGVIGFALDEFEMKPCVISTNYIAN